MSGTSSAGERPLRLGVSSCLLGNAVRYDGGHKRDRFVADLLGEFAEWVPVCPEVESGMGVPRPAVRLVRDGGALRMLEIQSGRDHTRRMQRYCAERVRALRALDLCGYVLKQGSPSCGLARVNVYAAKGRPKREGRGLFAAALLEAFPSLPVEEEGRLGDPRLRENFIERAFAYRRLRALFRGRWTRGQLVAFHTAHELQLLSHSPAAYRALGRRVAGLAGRPRAAFRERYQREFMAALAQLASRGRNASTLRHAAGDLKKLLDPASWGELEELIDDYRRGLIPRVVPVSVLARHARRYEVANLTAQTYLAPTASYGPK